MRTLRIAAPRPDPRAACIVLLPGAWQEPEDFLRAGFDRAIAQRALALELVLVAPELRHLADRDWLGELHGGVIQPARAAGRALWIGGISLGGFMALRCAARYPGVADGLCLIAPYLGNRLVAAEVAEQGGLRSWKAGDPGEDDDERLVWRYLQGLGAPPPAVFLGLGSDDRFAAVHRLLAEALPAASTRILPGGHDWPVWRQLWDNFLDRYAAAQVPPSSRRPSA
jgi:pimeloyl-ACP methyl ester carboxylesterase